MSALRLALPLWLARPEARNARRFPSLRRTLDVDVAIVGGGVTGAAVAWRFASAGVRVAVLEGRRVGRGSTAASSALLMQEPDEDFLALEARYGNRKAARIWELSRQATRDLLNTLRQLDVGSNVAARDSIYFTLDAAEVPHLRREHDRRVRAGVGGKWLDARALRRATGMDGAGAIRTGGNAQVDPYKACLGLLSASEQKGALIFETSPVRSIEGQRGRVTVHTSRGAVRASRVVIATGYATPEFKPLLARFRMFYTYVVVTRPLTARMRRRLGLSDVMLWDTDRPYHYARWTDDHRLLLGGADRRFVAGANRRRALSKGASELRAYFQGLYPSLRAVPTAYAWEGLFATTRDGLPYIGPHRRYPGHMFALGYGGNGMTSGFLAAGLLLQQLQGTESPDQELFAFSRKAAR